MFVVLAGSSRFTYGCLGRNVYLCVSIKTRVIIFEVGNALKNKCEKKKVN